MPLSDRELTDEALNFFYKNNYERCATGLRSKDIAAQFQAACVLLSINSSITKLDAEDAAGLIKRKFRILALRNHPDKYGHSEPLRAKAEEIFKLLTPARDILEEILKNPAVIGEKEILEQTPDIPERQYEFTHYEDDPYFYIHMARDMTTRYQLKKFWQFTQEVCPVSAGEGSSNPSTELSLYKPQLTVFKDAPKLMEVSGAEAFYYLFMAGALPRRFAQGHFDRVFYTDGAPLDPGRRWLLEKVLTTPEFLFFIDSKDWLQLALRATKENILPIGSNLTDAFIYYYDNYPETLYQRRIEKFYAHEGIDHGRLMQHILNNPYNLHSLSDRGLDALIGNSSNRFTEDLRKVVLREPLLAKKLSVHYTHTQLLHPYFNAINCPDDVYELKDPLHIAVEQLFYGNLSYLDLFSHETRGHIRSSIAQYVGIYFPHFVLQDIDDYIAELESDAQNIIVSTEPYRNGYSQPVDAWLQIKQEFFSGNFKVLEYLNKETLLKLADEPETNWTYYPLIIKVLDAFEETATEIDKYLQKLEAKLEIPLNNQKSREERMQFIEDKHAFIGLKMKEERTSQINTLLSDYEASLIKAGEASLQIENRLLGLGAGNELNELKQNLINDLKNDFFRLVEIIKVKGFDTDTLSEFVHIKQIVEKMGYQWQYFSEKDKNQKWLVGSLIYSMLDKILNLDFQIDRDEAPGLFGINYKDPNLDNSLNQLFQLYAGFSAENELFEKLCSLNIMRPEDQPKDIQDFTPIFIRQKLLDFLDRELLILIDEPHKRCNRELIEFPRLASLYERLGEEPRLLALLKTRKGHTIPVVPKSNIENLTEQNRLLEINSGQNKAKKLNTTVVNAPKPLSVTDAIKQVEKKCQKKQSSNLRITDAMEQENPSIEKSNLAEDLALVKEHFNDNSKIINILARLEKGSQSYNPYWMNSSKKLMAVVSALTDIIRQKSTIDDALKDENSALNKAINIQRISFFSPETKSQKIIKGEEPSPKME